MSSLDLTKYFPCVPCAPPAADAMRAFDEVWEATLKQGAGSVIDYRCPYPKHEFLTYLVEQKGLLMHGSNHGRIKVLLPMRFSEGVSYGSLDALYACSDGVWCIYYAIAHRNCPNASLKSYCFRAKDADGTAKKFYYFSLHEDMHKSQPWTDGMIYILPRTTFQQLKNDLGQLVEEWASDEPVVATAKIPVSPQDFPFLHCVQSHRTEAPAPAISRFATNYEAYVGRYTFSGDLSIDVTKNGNSLFMKFPGYPPAALTPIAPNSFRLRPLDIQVAFTNNEHCKPSQLALRLNGQNWVAHKLR